ncbi:MAG: HNH endonuclease, partial [Ktedonobacteraceae bacterium]|nr:HNH endonuclease [Ktedonobacteraceae bacterium]
MKVYVLSQEGTPLMPTTPRRARLWLKEKRARIARREPFTIRLRFAPRHSIQAATVGVDTGSQTVGIAAVANGEVLLQAEVHLRTEISRQMLQRRQYRRNRRSRKTRYRPARFANRRRKQGWLPPTVRAKVNATVKAVRFVASLLPVSQVHVEVASFDSQKMQNPEISGVEYQQGELQGYQVREYLLVKWNRRCAYCGATGVPLQVEHIIPKARRGSDRVSNLTLACQPCNQRKGNRTAAECGHAQIEAQARLPLRDAAQVSAMKTAIIGDLQRLFDNERVHVRYGYETKYQRTQVLHLPKHGSAGMFPVGKGH